MSEVVGSAAAPSAGQLLREARERQGLHIAALAASIKVTPKKLELLEADRFDALPDATFTRALAQTVCRALKIDPAAVLRLLPPPAGQRLEQVGEGLNAPFRERPGVGAQREGTVSGLGSAFWVTILILVAAIGLYFLPPGWLSLVGWRGGAVKSITAARAPSALPATPASGSLGSPSVGAPTILAAPADAEPTPPGAEPIPAGAEPAPVAAPPIGAAASS
ncbi:MAG TPA: helix-turn-helix domain-containing protein [Caldimonas sp.]|jgi:cytoskeleton protein RodZ|nr:helix-turn-helix domain-containing protein [Caldimonas sp.]HEX4236212.1 helix-turn-helix domain-containing protein [Caldimonas sp.]